jgi:tetratricopeptide (TPR) repeat protein
MQKSICFSLLLLCAPVSFGAPADDFKAGNKLYDEGKFTEAVAAYEKIEPKTAHVYFNLGNAWFRQDKLGLAILNYERARRLAPRDPDIIANLKFAEQKLGVDEANSSPKAGQTFLRSVVESRTLTEWSRYEIAGLWLAVLAVAAWIFLPKLRTGCLIVAVGAFMGFAVSAGALGYRVANERTAPQGVVVASETEARFAPAPDSTVHFRLGEGTKVAIREDRGQWLCVERADGQQGWVNAEAISRIASP